MASVKIPFLAQNGILSTTAQPLKIARPQPSQARLYVLELSLLSFVFAAATDCSTTALMAQASL